MSVRFLAAAIAALLATSAMVAVARRDLAAPTAAEPLRITSPRDGSSRNGNVIELSVKSRGFHIAATEKPATKGPDLHYHVFIDRDPVEPGEPIPNEPGIMRFAEELVEVRGLSIGKHTLTVVLATADDRRYLDHEDSTRVRVNGPTVQITPPPAVTARDKIPLQLRHDGVDLVEPDGKDTSNDRGHFVLLVDQAPPPPEQPFPAQGLLHTTAATVEIGPLPPGKHRIVVFLAHGDNTRFRPRVSDVLTFEVAP